MNLRLHNICWSRRYAVWCRYAGGGWWGRGSIVSPEMRGFYEKFLPFNEFRHSLITIGEQILESPDWVPNILRSNDILSLPDFWAMLPDAFAGRVTFTEDELFPWDFIDAGPSKGFLLDEWHKALEEQVTPNCHLKCSSCGAAKFGCGVCFNQEDGRPLLRAKTGQVYHYPVESCNPVPGAWKAEPGQIPGAQNQEHGS